MQNLSERKEKRIQTKKKDSRKKRRLQKKIRSLKDLDLREIGMKMKKKRKVKRDQQLRMKLRN